MSEASSRGGTSYGQAIREGFAWLMSRYPKVFAIGQGLWSPWYVGNSMTDLDKEFGRDRVLDTPVSEAACTGAAIGAALCGYRPIVIHPRVDFMLLAVDQIVNQAAKWRHMLGGQCSPAVTVRAIINRGGRAGSAALAGTAFLVRTCPGPAGRDAGDPADARDLLIASVLCDDPVLYIDDRWLYEERERLPEAAVNALKDLRPVRRRAGVDATLVGAGYAARLARTVADNLAERRVSCDVWDLRVVNPLEIGEIVASTERTGRLCVIDGGWKTCGLAGEVIARVSEAIEPSAWRSRPVRMTLPDAPAPTSKALEELYYPDARVITEQLVMSFGIRTP